MPATAFSFLSKSRLPTAPLPMSFLLSLFLKGARCLILLPLLALSCHSLAASGVLNTSDEEVVEVLMKTEAGEIRLQLFPQRAPLTVANFLAYVDGKRYNDGAFYRVVRSDNQAQNKIKIAVIQGGMGMDAGLQRLAPINHETTQKTGLLHRDGVISLARGKPGSGQSEFFICVGDQAALDFGGQRNPDGQGFATFGRVVNGMEVVRKIHQRATTPANAAQLEYTSGQMLQPPVVITAIERVNKS